MTEKRVKAKLSGICGGNDTLRLVSVLVDEDVEIPYELDLVWNEPDNPPHQCPGLAGGTIRFNRPSDTWAQIDSQGIHVAFDVKRCPCCDWTVPAEQPKPEPEPERGPEWILLRDVKHLGWFETENGARYLRVGEEDADGLIVVSRDIGSYAFMPSNALVKPVDPFAQQEAADD